MELQLNYDKYKRAAAKYAVLYNDCKKWKDTHKEACDLITENENSGNWEKNFADKTTALDALFLEFAKKMKLMCTTFEAADDYIGKMFAQVQALDPAVVSGTAYAGNKSKPTGGQTELMYESATHNLIIDGCLAVEAKTEEEKRLLSDISGMIGRLKYADSAIALMKNDVAKMETGLKKQANITPFAETFQAYVREVDEFNTNVSSQFASVVGTLPGGDDSGRKDPGKEPEKEPEKDNGNKDNKDNQNRSNEPQKVVIEIDRGDSDRYREREGGYAGGGYAGGGYAGGGYSGNGGSANLTAGNKDLFDFVRGHKGFENYTDNQIMECFSKMGAGSSFEAHANSIFDQYKNDPAGFEKKFGFPLYDENGKFNYYKLAFDEFAKGNAGGLDSTAGTGAGAGNATPGVAGASRSSAKAEKPVVKGLDKDKIV